jgi:DNA-binding Xre family transcriptional regulator
MIGKKISKIRQSKRLSYRALSERTGINTKNLSEIEKDRVDCRLSTLEKILEPLGCQIEIIEKPTE